MDIVLPEAEWQEVKRNSHGGAVTYYSAGNGSTTFRVPDVGAYGMVLRQMGGDRPSTADAQKGHADQNKAHEHGFIGNALPPHGHNLKVMRTNEGGAKSGNFVANGDKNEAWMDMNVVPVSAGTPSGTVMPDGGSEVTMKFLWCSVWIWAR